jgi:hypothetical protein
MPVNQFLCINSKEESRCEVACDVKSQLKIFERIDKFHVNQRKEREREMLLKAAKVATNYNFLCIINIDINEE